MLDSVLASTLYSASQNFLELYSKFQVPFLLFMLSQFFEKDQFSLEMLASCFVGRALLRSSQQKRLRSVLKRDCTIR